MKGHLLFSCSRFTWPPAITNKARIGSAVLPKLTFSRPPTEGPTRSAIRGAPHPLGPHGDGNATGNKHRPGRHVEQEAQHNHRRHHQRSSEQNPFRASHGLLHGHPERGEDKLVTSAEPCATSGGRSMTTMAAWPSRARQALRGSCFHDTNPIRWILGAVGGQPCCAHRGTLLERHAGFNG